VTITQGNKKPKQTTIIFEPVAFDKTEDKIDQENPVKIFNKAWPLEILAKSRILKLRILEK